MSLQASIFFHCVVVVQYFNYLLGIFFPPESLSLEKIFDQHVL